MPGNNTYIYALNDVAEEALRIAQNDERVKQIINEQKDKALTIAAVQPTVILDDRNKKLIGSIWMESSTLKQQISTRLVTK